jgi:hypothetical protein
VIRGGTWILLGAAIATLVLWFFLGGRQKIKRWLAVREAAQQGWDVSQADRYPHYRLISLAYLPTGLALLGVGVTRLIADVRRSKGANERTSKAG